MDEENIPAVDDQTEVGGEFSNKKVRRRKKQLYKNIRNQMEFYFSDANVTKDRFLGKLMQEDPNIDISIFLSFNRIRKLTTDVKDIALALRDSDLLSVTEDGTKVFRTTPVTQKANTDECTIYVEQLPSDAQHDWLKEVFSAYGNVSYVSIPKYRSSGKIKGFAFVEFETTEGANKTLEAFGAKGCRLPAQMAPEKLCSIQTFEHDEEKPEAIPDEEIKRESTDEDPDNPSRKKKRKKKLKVQISEEANVEDVDPELSSETAHQTKPKKRKKSEDHETEESNAEEAVEEDAPSRKKKRKKSDSNEGLDKAEENVEDTSDIAESNSDKKIHKRKSENVEGKLNDEELENTEIQISKQKSKKVQEVEENEENVPEEEINKHSERKKRKRNSEEVKEINETIGENEEKSEVTENEEVEETGDEEPMEEGAEGEGKKRRRKSKKPKKKKPDLEADRLKILPKKEWKRLRNKYLDLQKAKMKCLKHYMGNKWNRGTPARSQQSNGNVQEKEEPGKPMEKPRISFTPGVIVHAVMAEPVVDIRKFKADVKGLSEVEYVDVMMGANEAFIRCASTAAAENLVSSKPWQQTELLKGDDEKRYWDRIFEDRHQKFSEKVRVKQRGRQKILSKVERELGKHIRFDD